MRVAGSQITHEEITGIIPRNPESTARRRRKKEDRRWVSGWTDERWEEWNENERTIAPEKMTLRSKSTHQKVTKVRRPRMSPSNNEHTNVRVIDRYETNEINACSLFPTYLDTSNEFLVILHIKRRKLCHLIQQTIFALCSDSAQHSHSSILAFHTSKK